MSTIPKTAHELFDQLQKSIASRRFNLQSTLGLIDTWAKQCLEEGLDPLEMEVVREQAQTDPLPQFVLRTLEAHQSSETRAVKAQAKQLSLKDELQDKLQNETSLISHSDASKSHPVEAQVLDSLSVLKEDQSTVVFPDPIAVLLQVDQPAPPKDVIRRKKATTISHHEAKIVLQALWNKGIPVDHVSKDSFTISTCLLACCSGFLDIVKLCLNHGADPTRVNHYGHTATFCAAEYGFAGVIEELLCHPMNYSLDARYSYNPILKAARQGHFEVVKLLTHYVQMHHPVHLNDQQALYCAAEGGQLEIARYFLHRGVDPQARPEHGVFPLHKAVQSGNIALIDLLLEYGADINTKTATTELTPLHFVAGLNHHFRFSETFDYLIKQPILMDEVDSDGNTPLFMLCEYADDSSESVSAVRQLIELKADVNVINHKHQSPLWTACQHGRFEFVKLLLKSGAQLIPPSEKNLDTELHLAAGLDKTDILDLLLQHPVDLNAQNREENTPYHLAIHHLDALKKLTQAGADFSIKNHKGHTPLSLLLTHFEDSACIQYLQGLEIALQEKQEITQLLQCTDPQIENDTSESKALIKPLRKTTL